MKTRSLFCLILMLTLASPAEAVINCFDYAFYRATGIDPRPTASPISKAIDVRSLQCYLGALGFTQLPNPPRDDRDLQPDDILIFGPAHAGFVNGTGKIDHFIQVWGASGKKYDVSALPPAKVHLSPNRDLLDDPPGGKPSGSFSNHTLQQFINSAFRPSDRVHQWRKTGAASITARELLLLEILLYQAEEALKAGKLNEAGQALAQTKRIVSPPACLAQKLTELYERLMDEILPSNFIPLSEEESALLGAWNNVTMKFGNTAIELFPGGNFIQFNRNRTYRYQAHTKGANPVYTRGIWRSHRSGSKRYLTLEHTHVRKGGSLEALPKRRESTFEIQSFSGQRLTLFEAKEDPAYSVTLVYDKRN